MFSLRGENLNLLAIMEHASLSLQPCGFVSDLQTLVWFPVYFFFVTAAAYRKTSISRAQWFRLRLF